jgi:general secretion pathway protein G
MLIVVAMCALLASIAMPLSEIAATRAKEAELRHALREIRGAIDRYKAAVDTGNITRRADESGYPPSLLVLVEGVVDATDPQRRKLVFLRRVPRDPFAPNDGSPAHASWGLRSYLSDAQEPREGSDVFDVYSRSERVGLNSMPYRQW